jgi:hypothetical protein
MSQSGIEPTTFRLVALCLKQLLYRVPSAYIYIYIYIYIYVCVCIIVCMYAYTYVKSNIYAVLGTPLELQKIEAVMSI